jgi:hypothetical protein
VLGGVSVFEAQAFHLTQELDRLAVSIEPANPDSVEFHASEIFSRRIPPWSRMTKTEAQGIIKAVLQVFVSSYESARAFVCAIHKPSFLHSDLVELAFEELCNRFDRYLNRLRGEGDRQRGLIILDESSYETTLQSLAINFRHFGTKWGVIRNLADTPLFVNSKASRILQLADHVAYAVFRRYNAGDTQYFDIIASRFDSAGGVIHGLSHRHALPQPCMCPACLTRRAPSEF